MATTYDPVSGKWVTEQGAASGGGSYRQQSGGANPAKAADCIPCDGAGGYCANGKTCTEVMVDGKDQWCCRGGGSTNKCTGKTCPQGQTCDPVDGVCKSKPDDPTCGALKQKCCAGNQCDGALSCDPNSKTCVTPYTKECQCIQRADGSGGKCVGPCAAPNTNCKSTADCKPNNPNPGGGSCCPGKASQSGCQKWCTSHNWGTAKLNSASECCCSNKPEGAGCSGGGGETPEGSTCIPVASKGQKCPDGYEPVGDCCYPGQYNYNGPTYAYGYTRNPQTGKWEANKGDFGLLNTGVLQPNNKLLNIQEGDIGDYGGDKLNNNINSLLTQLEGESKNDPIKLKQIQNLLADPNFANLTLLKDTSLQGMTDLLNNKINELINNPKGYTDAEQDRLLQRMRGQIGEQYRQSGEANQAALAERGLLDSGLGASELAKTRNATAESQANAARDVALENMQRKTAEQQAALGLGQTYLTGQQAYFNTQQERDLQKQLEQKGLIEKQQAFLTDQQQKDLDAQIANQESKFKAFDLRNAVLGTQADWVMAQKNLDLQRQEYNAQNELSRANYELERHKAHEELKLEAARFGLDAETMEASVNTARMAISQNSTSTILQYLQALLNGATGA